MTDGECFREMTELGVLPAPASTGAVVIHAEDGRDCRVVLVVVRPPDWERKVAIVTLERCKQSVFGYPNEEAYRDDPRVADSDMPGNGFHEVLSSTWDERLLAYNRRAFPDCTPSHSGLRHFFIGCQDASGEFLARDLKVEVTDGSYQEALAEAVNRTVRLDPL